MAKKKKKYRFQHDMYIYAGSIEHELRRTGNPPEKGKNREEKKKPTAEQMQKVNAYNREKKVRRLIKENFQEGDYFCTLTYQKGFIGDIHRAKQDRQKFMNILRKEFRKAGYELKWIGRSEVGKRGSMHHHIIINRIPGGDLIISKAWAKIFISGRVDFVPLYARGGYKELAAYLVKPDKEDKDGNQTSWSSYSRSRNLKETEPEVTRTTRRKILEYPEPTPGYYIDTDSIYQGINEVTGREYLHYIEIKLEGGG